MEIDSARIKITGTITSRSDDYGLTDSVNSLSKAIEFAFSNGVGAQEANILFHGSGTITAGSTVDIDLFASAGGEEDPFGDDLIIDGVKFIIIKLGNDRDTGSSVEVYGHAVNGFEAMFANLSDHLVILPGGVVVLGSDGAAGYLVDATHKILVLEDMADGAGNCPYEIIVLGET